MTVLKKLSFLLLTPAIILACEDPLPEPLGPGSTIADGNPSSQLFEATVDFSKISGSVHEFDPVISLKVQYDGNGSSNMMPLILLEANHVEEAFPNHDRWDLRQGNFVITGDKDNSIYGSYSGFGFSNATANNLTWLLTIQGGTGRFTSAHGNLTAEVHESIGTTGRNQAKITGVIYLDDPI